MTPEREARVRAIWSGAQKVAAQPRPIGALLKAIADSIAKGLSVEDPEAACTRCGGCGRDPEHEGACGGCQS